MSPDIVGWVASVLLLATITQQVVKQWRTSSNEGVSAWLFLGQLSASLGFLIYAWLLDNRVFIVTNTALVLAALVGELLFLRNRHGAAKSECAEK